MIPKNAPKGGPVAIMVGTRADLSTLLEKLSIDPGSAFPLFLSRLYGIQGERSGLFLAGPMVGAPYAVMVLETLIALGVKRVLFYGWCGAVSKDVRIGEMILPTESIIDEGTSRHYRVMEEKRASPKGSAWVKPADLIQDDLRKTMTRLGLSFREGPVWCTDAIFRETPMKTIRHQRKGVLAVEMETSALFSVGRFHGIQVGGFLVVSDEISSLKWRPGFKDEAFRSARHNACEVIHNLWQTL